MPIHNEKAKPDQFSASLGPFQSAVDRSLIELREQRIVPRIWAHDHTVWKPEPTEITNRLGWLHSPQVMVDAVPEIQSFVDSVRAEGFTDALLLGMGGSSLAPEVFRRTFGVQPGYPDLAVLDSTDPGAVLSHVRRLNMEKTLFIVSTKSGGTVETFSFFKYFYNQVAAKVGDKRAGHHFVAITDPGSGLASTAKGHDFRKTFLNDANIGGRYSALSYFGLVPAALIGMDIKRLLETAAAMARNCEVSNGPAGVNPGAWLGSIIGELAVAGRDKLTLITSPALAAFGPWVEQLVAESTGKEGKGILPVEGETLGGPNVYFNDRLFVYLKLKDDTNFDAQIQALRAAGHPVVQLELNDAYDLGGEFFRWEMATVIAGRKLGINPFDQPNVESAKVLAKAMVSAYQEKGKLPEPTPALQSNGIRVFTDGSPDHLQQALNNFLALARHGGKKGESRSYVALQAYVEPTSETDRALNLLRLKLRDRFKFATTVGYGPRFLHSTGQLHKGDSGNGLFIQITGDPPEDVPIPDKAGSEFSAITFGILELAQALGDRKALMENGRKVIRIHLAANVADGIRRLNEYV